MKLVELTEYDHLKQFVFKMSSSQDKADFMLYIHMHFLTGSNFITQCAHAHLE